MSVVSVVNVRGIAPGSPEARNLVYCGRATPNGWPAHPLANPHKLSREDAKDPARRAEVIARYRAELAARPDLDVQLANLWAETECGKKPLGCWCAPLACHCDALAELLTDRFG